MGANETCLILNKPLLAKYLSQRLPIPTKLPTSSQVSSPPVPAEPCRWSSRSSRLCSTSRPPAKSSAPGSPLNSRLDFSLRPNLILACVHPPQKRCVHDLAENRYLKRYRYSGKETEGCMSLTCGQTEVRAKENLLLKFRSLRVAE